MRKYEMSLCYVVYLRITKDLFNKGIFLDIIQV